MNAVDDYIAKLDEPEKSALGRLVKIIDGLCPAAKQVITYGMPGFKYNNKYLISFGVFKDHMSIFPGAGAIASNSHSLSGYKTSKGTIQFTVDNQIPHDLFEKIINYRVAEIESNK